MDENDQSIGVSSQAGGAAVPGRADCKSPTAPPLLDLNEDEMRVFEYICRSLREAGVEHLTAGMPIAVIVRTYADWIAAYVECETKGRYQTAQSGWASPTPWASDEQRLKMELGQWLPKACLTIPQLDFCARKLLGGGGLRPVGRTRCGTQEPLVQQVPWRAMRLAVGAGPGKDALPRKRAAKRPPRSPSNGWATFRYRRLHAACAGGAASSDAGRFASQIQ